MNLPHRACAALVSLTASMLLTHGTSAAVISDDFNGNSGGVPSTWTDIGFDASPGSTVVESGSVVTISDARGNGGPQIIQSSAFGGVTEITLSVNIAGMTSFDGSEPEAILGIGSFASYSLLAQFNSVTQTFRVSVFGATSGNLVLPGSLGSYSGGALSYTLTADADSFRVTSPTDSYDSGDILFTAIGAGGFDSIDDLGSSITLLLGTESAGNPPEGTLAQISYDQVTLNATFAVIPEPSHALLVALAAAAFAARRRR